VKSNGTQLVRFIILCTLSMLNVEVSKLCGGAKHSLNCRAWIQNLGVQKPYLFSSICTIQGELPFFGPMDRDFNRQIILMRQQRKHLTGANGRMTFRVGAVQWFIYDDERSARRLCKFCEIWRSRCLFRRLPGIRCNSNREYLHVGCEQFIFKLRSA